MARHTCVRGLRAQVRPLFVIALALSAAGCLFKAKPPVVPAITVAAPQESKISSTMTVVASADTNPDSSGRPSPVAVRVYLLTADAGFSKVDYFALFDDPEKALGAELITHRDLVLSPGDRQLLELSVSKDTRYVGVMAGFRDARNAQWKAIVGAPKEKDSLLASVERSRVVVSTTSK